MRPMSLTVPGSAALTIDWLSSPNEVGAQGHESDNVRDLQHFYANRYAPGTGKVRTSSLSARGI